MKITFVLPYAGLAGGIRVVAIYADLLRKRGHDITVVSLPLRQPTKMRRRLRRLGLLGNPPHGPSHMDGLDVPWRVLERRRPIEDRDVPDADVVIATWWETAEWVAALSPSKGAKVHFVQGHETFPGQPVDRVKAAYRLPLRKITIARGLVDILRADYGVENAPMIPNAVDHDQFFAPPRGRQFQPTVGFLCSAHWAKGFDVMRQSLQAIRQNLPDLRVVTFGHSPPSGDQPLPSGAEFILRPTQQQIRDVYSRLDVWMCGSRSEGFHLMPLEAMACRTPVVGTRVGGCVETIRPGVNGYLVDIGDAESLAARVLDVLTLDDTCWRALSDGAAAVAAEFSWDRCTDMFETWLARVVSGAVEAAPATTAGLA